MNHTSPEREPVLVTGWSKLTTGIISCLRQAGHPVTVYAGNPLESLPVSANQLEINPSDRFVTVVEQLEEAADSSLVIACTDENEDQKKALIRQLETVFSPDVLIAINTESIPLSALQEDARHPERIIGANWTIPADTTYFLEIIANDKTDTRQVNAFYSTARLVWQKDPYLIHSDNGIRTRLLCAMIREAFFLVENGYVTVEDVDRACRNDPGYYLPFAGNFRYMDLMGTFIYGVVMQDLFPELSKARHVPRFFNETVQDGGLGMVTEKGFYTYKKDEPEQWEESFREFSQQIRHLISKYPFNYAEVPQRITKQPVVQ
ncbi:3-hydroxyacyl-CoA dehydrogenase family protein [Larkinella terrae]|uniref:3-hydroxyacyl-CoA dehydrogenase n=1 Tax=Larkinella terrae TaxID=2025311 RepID=A0A7K0EF43_9BACT|nr:3-hydroxyacyl-CoA dehydrogenase NAD-binding domain-containing protein [Larkinella terrae]MRS60444.1 3-hydroxyacyl-CoA dehydrogenase [Larkinella terrae]